MRYRFLALSLISMSAYSLSSTLAAENNGFQGIPWGASEKQIDSRFTKGLKKNDCSEFSRMLNAQLGEVCDYPYIEPYEVVGIPFKLSFLLNAKSRKLQRVGLYYSGDLDSITTFGTSDTEREWINRFGNLERALTDRYGKPERVNTESNSLIIIAIRIWRMDETIIQLKSQLTKKSAASSAREEYSILYSSIPMGEGGKL
jgi:hypothetical protein